MTDMLTTPDEISPETAVRTFLIADVRGYTTFTVEHGDEAAARLAGVFADLAREIVAASGGEVIELRGDEALAVFTSSRQALRAAVTLQERFAAVAADDPLLPLRVGMGLDAGEALPVQGGYRGSALNLAARLCSLAGPGEVLASDGVIHLARKLDGLSYLERGLVPLKGFADPVRVVQVVREAATETSAADTPRTPSLPPLPIGGFLGSLPGGALVGRDLELRRFLAVIDAVAGGSGRLVLLAGEPGVGKTRLAQEVTLATRNRGFLLATGRCYEAEGAVPFYPWLDALATLYAGAPASIRADVLRRWPDVARLLPDQVGPPPLGSMNSPEEQQLLFRAVSGLVGALVEQGPIAILLDDLHWADASSLKLLQHLARQTRGQSVLLFGTYRDVEIGRQHPLEAALRDLDREELLERVLIRRLDEGGTQALIAATMGESEISGEFTSLVHGRTEGNPFFVQQVLRVLIERGDVFRKDGRWDRKSIAEIEVPESVRSVIGQRLTRLVPETQELLREASVLGQTFNFDELLALSEVDERGLEVALDEARTAGMVRETGRDTYGFDHALTQQALYSELSSRRRRRLHLAAGEAIEALPERSRQTRAAELAWHFLEGDAPERALPYALQAGASAAAVFAHSEAEWHYRTAAELAREMGDDARLAEALEALGMVLQTAGRYAEALDTLEEAAQRYSTRHDTEGEARVVAQMGWSHSLAGTPQEGINRVQQLLARLGGERATHGTATLFDALAQLYFSCGEYDQMYEAATRGAELARAVGDDRLLARALLRQDTFGIDLYDEVIDLAEKIGDLDTLSRALNNAAVAYLQRGDLVRHRELRQRSLELAEREANPGHLGFALAAVCQSLDALGDWQLANEYGERALEMGREAGTGWFASYLRMAPGWLRVRQGWWEGLEELLEEALAIAEGARDVQGLSIARAALGDLALLQGRPQRAVERIAGAVVTDGAPWVEPTLARIYVEAGEEDRAEEILRSLLKKSRGAGLRYLLSEGLDVEGVLRTRQERWDEAEAAFTEALELARDMGWKLHEGRILLNRGTMWAQRGDHEPARTDLLEAEAVLARLGARPYLERAERVLGQLK